MAAGEGRRLRPLTDRWPKPLLPIDGRPVITSLLRELQAAGIRRATVVTGHLAEQLEAFLDGWTGLELHFVRQPAADGSGDAVRRAVAGGAMPPLLVTAADTAYSAGDVGRFVEAFERSGAEGGLALTRDPPPGEGKPPVRLADGLVTGIGGPDPDGSLSATPLWALAAEFVRYLPRLTGPPYELADAAERGIDDGLRMIGVEIGRTRDITHPEDLVLRNFPYLGE
jgi:CTP:molybdopterin cytidylyltransferase MocA